MNQTRANDATEVLEGDLTGQVSFKHVDFQYVADKPLIRDFNLEVNPGEMVAIVGPTGAGKSTIINLLMRFYDVTAGSISVGGHDIRHLSRQDYRKQFGMVLQDAWLYEELSRKIFALVISRRLTKKSLKLLRLPMWITLSVRCLVVTTWK